MSSMISATNITKTYINGPIETKVLRGVDLDVPEGQWLAIMGKSGAGKSTLMYQMSLLDQPTDGTVIVDGTDIISLDNNQKTDFRLRKLGYVFQDYALMPELTALENVAIPMLMLGKDTAEAYQLATESLQRVGLGSRLGNLPSQLSGGEQQRVSIARAVAQQPKILFADEPTANLDSVSSQAIIELFKEIHESGQTIVMVTHEKEYTSFCDRIVYLDDGQIVDEEIQNQG